MEPADCPFARIPRGIALNETVYQALFVKFPCAKCPREETPAIFMRLRLDDKGTSQLRRDEAHYFDQKKLSSIWCVRIKYSSCLSRVNVRCWNTSSVMSTRLNRFNNCSAPRLASQRHLKSGRYFRIFSNDTR